MKNLAAIILTILAGGLLIWISESTHSGFHYSLDGVEHVLVIR